jgi:hypothetical protein
MTSLEFIASIIESVASVIKSFAIPAVVFALIYMFRENIKELFNKHAVKKIEGRGFTITFAHSKEEIKKETEEVSKKVEAKEHMKGKGNTIIAESLLEAIAKTELEKKFLNVWNNFEFDLKQFLQRKGYKGFKTALNINHLHEKINLINEKQREILIGAMNARNILTHGGKVDWGEELLRFTIAFIAHMHILLKKKMESI